MVSKKKLKKALGILQHALLGMSGFLQVLDQQRQEALRALAEHDAELAKTLARKFQASDRTITTMLRDEMEQGMEDAGDD
ncbi:hypothetical protein [uncultured Rothia sp.]|uniref:hypothetical protein n=1 Tax=uncultured Rothia sp. TaxID=316088 RepID=UPI002615F0D4|nr:hypothetical protein [uncultured Rothia sp.]